MTQLKNPLLNALDKMSDTTEEALRMCRNEYKYAFKIKSDELPDKVLIRKSYKLNIKEVKKEAMSLWRLYGLKSGSINYINLENNV